MTGVKAVSLTPPVLQGPLYLLLLKSCVINIPVLVSKLYTDNFTVPNTHSKRLNCGQGTMGFLQSACWFVRYSVIIESRVTWDSTIPGMHPVVTVEVFFKRGDELITQPCSHEICFCKERLLQVPPEAGPCTFLKQKTILKTAMLSSQPIPSQTKTNAEFLKIIEMRMYDNYSNSRFLNSSVHTQEQRHIYSNTHYIIQRITFLMPSIW
jgi:hypothetical protein